VEEHQGGLQVNYINGLAVFGLQKEDTKSVPVPSEDASPVAEPISSGKNINESEESIYEQTSLFSSDTLYRPEEVTNSNTQSDPAPVG
jgi:hypothetical protein